MRSTERITEHTLTNVGLGSNYFGTSHDRCARIIVAVIAWVKAIVCRHVLFLGLNFMYRSEFPSNPPVLYVSPSLPVCKSMYNVYAPGFF